MMHYYQLLVILVVLPGCRNQPKKEQLRRILSHLPTYQKLLHLTPGRTVQNYTIRRHFDIILAYCVQNNTRNIQSMLLNLNTCARWHNTVFTFRNHSTWNNLYPPYVSDVKIIRSTVVFSVHNVSNGTNIRSIGKGNVTYCHLIVSSLLQMPQIQSCELQGWNSSEEGPCSVAGRQGELLHLCLHQSLLNHIRNVAAMFLFSRP